MADVDDDDAALAWAGDEPDRPARPASPVEPVETKPVETKPVETKPRATTPVESRLVESAPAKTPTPAALLVSYGILAGAYLLYTIGWITSVQRYNALYPASLEPLNAIMFGLGEILAMASPAVWFGAAFVLTRGRKPVIRLLSLLAGLVAVLPWPFVMGAWQ